MAGALRKTMVYLGLAEEDDAYGYDDYHERDRSTVVDGRDERGRHLTESSSEELGDPAMVGVAGAAGATAATATMAPSRRIVERSERTPERSTSSVAGVSTIMAAEQDDEPAGRRAAVTPLPRRTPVREVVKDMEVGGVHRITTIHPRTYNEAKKIGESFREGTPVIMNLTDLDDADAKRLVDFAAGLVFGLQGAIERVTNKVFLLSPADVEVTTIDGEPAKGTKGIFNQS
ncbi:MAG: cell division protein SepF [Micrococcales bacterium]|nr:cell division protein SepF [Micrococcales bacterium]